MYDYNRILKLADQILAIPSPSGYTKNVIDFLINLCEKEGYQYEKTNTGNLVVTIKGESN